MTTDQEVNDLIQNSGSWEAVYLTKALQDFKKEKERIELEKKKEIERQKQEELQR